MKNLLALTPLFFILSCGASSQEDEKDYVETEFDKKIATYLEDQNWKPERESNGLYIYVEEEGGEFKPGLEDFLTLKYEGRLLDGTVFDGTGGEAISFPFPVKNLIEGWQQGIPHFGKGGKGKLIVPPALGYGDQDSGPIPGNSILVFDIEIVDFSPTQPKPQIDRSVDYSPQIDEYIKSKKLKGFEKTETGLYIKIDNAGSADKPTGNSFLTLNYEGYLLNGEAFDGTGGEPTTFNFTLGNTIMGWQEGIPNLGKGGKGTLIIPPYIGYGPKEAAGGAIPGNSVLVFDIEIIDFSDTPPGQ